MRLDQVQRNYDRAARHYDTWTQLVFGRLLDIERLREDAIELLGDIDGKVVLDVGCGTGRNFPLLVPRVGPKGQVIGVDYSRGMLDEARALVVQRGWENVELMHDDAAELATVPAAVDAVISVWCMGIVHDLDAALGRALDVLRPGGRIVIMDFDRARPDRGCLRWLYPVYSRLLRWAGIDSAEDLDDDRLRAKWKSGRGVLQRRLGSLEEERYLSGGGVILSGTAPRLEKRP
ncbi:MAG: class I SAM-dependent methyltransferase [Deltaproteobacteria bacterium]|nr:class I SAM-dependent methyltransferase [Deltaproteobacteria bacterium]